MEVGREELSTASRKVTEKTAVDTFLEATACFSLSLSSIGGGFHTTSLGTATMPPPKGKRDRSGG